MKINLEDPCICGHTASWHGSEETEFPIGDHTIKLVTLFLHCTNIKKTEPYDYTNFGSQCSCEKFRLDNLEFLRKKHESHS